MKVTVELDFETGERAGAGGTFQVISITAEDGRDLTDYVDQGRHYTSIDELEEDLSAEFKTPVTVVED